MIKSLGLVTVLASSTLLGVLKAEKLKKRTAELNSICVSLSKLGGLIRVDAGEKNELIKASFPKTLISFCGGGIKVGGVALKNSDKELLSDFITNIGMSDKESEYNRIKVFSELFKSLQQESEKIAAEQSKLYSSLGFLAGLCICIFLL